MTPDSPVPSGLLVWCLRCVLPRDQVAAVLGDIAEAHARRRLAGRVPRYPRLWCDGQALDYLVRSIAAGVPSSWRRGRFVFRDSWRALRSAPATTTFAFLVLTLAIAAATVTFSVVDTVVLRQLPFDHSEDLVVLASVPAPNTPLWVSPVEVQAWRGRLDALDSWAAVAPGSEDLSIDGEPVRIVSARVTASLFDVLRTRPLVGHLFSEADEQPGREPVAVIGYGLWQRMFGGSPRAVGARLELRSGPVTVLGVLAPDGGYPVGAVADMTTEIWTPFVVAPDTARSGPGGLLARYLTIVGRLRQGASATVALAQLRAATQSLIQTDPFRYDHWSPTLVPLYEALVGPVRSWMLLALSAVVLLLLVACVNIANLLLTRSASRARELAVRAALGATRRHLVVVLMVESVCLSMAAAIAALAVSVWGVAVAKAALPTGIARSGLIALDLRVFATAMTAALVTGLAVGAIPAWQSSRADVVSLLKDSGAGMTSNRRRWRSAFVVIEVALAGVLLVAMTLFVSSFVSVVRASLGFDRSGLVALSARSPLTSPVPDVVRALRAVPGVTSVAAYDDGSAPLLRAAGLGGAVMGMSLVRADAPLGTASVQVGVMRVSAAYFGTAGIPLLRGSSFDETDSAQALIILDDEVARRLFGGQDPVGAKVSAPGGVNLATVVGVAAHVRAAGPEGAQGLQVYWPLPLVERGAPPQFLIRLSRPVPTVGASLQQTLGTFVRVGTHPATLTAIDDAFRRVTAQRRFSASLMAVFGTLALFIGSAGVYGVMSSVVAQQTREFAVRVALGATPGQVSRGILRQAANYLLSGLALGLPAAWWVSRGFTASLYGVHPTDAFVYVLVAIVLVVAGLLASWRPARRASRVDPIVALKTG